MTKFKKKGLYALFYPPVSENGINWQDIKVGRTARPFEKRFQGYTGPLSVHRASKFMLPLDTDLYSTGFCAEEKKVKDALFKMAQENPYTMIKYSKGKKGEWYRVQAHVTGTVLEKIFDVFIEIKNAAAPPVLAPPVLSPPVLAPPVLSPPVLSPPVLSPPVPSESMPKPKTIMEGMFDRFAWKSAKP